MDRSRLIQTIREKYEGKKIPHNGISPGIGQSNNERVRRLWAAMEAKKIGWGGITIVAEATGIAHSTIRRGMRELKELQTGQSEMCLERSRCPGGGRKKKGNQ